MKLKKGLVITFLLTLAFNFNVNKTNLVAIEKEDLIIDIYFVV